MSIILLRFQRRINQRFPKIPTYALKVAAHFLGVKHPQIFSPRADTQSTEYYSVWNPARQVSGALFHRFSWGSIEILAIVDECPDPASALIIADTIEKCALNSTRFAAHTRRFLIKQQVGIIRAEVIFVTSSPDKYAILSKSLKKCLRSHAFKHVSVNATAIDISSASVTCERNGLLFSGSRAAQKRLSALFQ